DRDTARPFRKPYFCGVDRRSFSQQRATHGLRHFLVSLVAEKWSVSMSAGVDELSDFALLHQAVEYHAEHSGSRTAIDDGTRSLTYAELSRQMHQLAAILLQHGLSRHARVGLCIENGIPAVIGMLGALRAGGCYVPIPPSFPAERNSMIVADADLSALVTTDEYLPCVRAILPL